MQTLIAILKPFLLIVAQRVGPDVLPRSQFLLVVVIAANIAVSWLVLDLLNIEPARRIIIPFLDAATQCLLISVLLLSMKLGNRLVQTLIAAYGADMILNLVSLPLALVPASDPPRLTLPVLASVVVLFWSLGVKGHILHRAAGFPYFVGVLIAAGFFIAFLFLDSAIFGTPA